MANLTDLGRKYGTDKTDEHHSFKGQCYTDIYNRYLNHLQDQEFNFLEIGVREGRSIKMWSEYFPNATIVGVDIDPECKKYESGNIKIHIGSQEDEQFLKEIIAQYQKFKVILDDGSHINSMIMKSFDVLNKHATDFYIVEDLRNSYEDLTMDVLSWPGMHLNVNLNSNNADTRPQFNEMILNLVKRMDYRTGEWTGINFHSQMVVMQKKVIL
jgi:hypothetical protein